MIALAIAQQTIKEAFRRRVMWIFLIIGVFLISLGPVFGFLTPRDSQTVLRSLGLAAILLAGLFVTIVTCIYLIPAEIERRTIYTVLSKPVQRYEFVLGKFLGGFATVFINIAAMGVVFLAMIYFQERRIPAEMFKGVMLTFFQMMLLAALTIFFSTFTTPVVNFFLSFGIFMIGNLTTVTESLTTKSNPLVRGVGTLVHYLLPNFGNFNIQNSIIRPQIEIANEQVFLRNNILYAIIYSSVLLVLAILIFDRREV
ncbi:MAG: ABC transporter permease subunit [Chloroherpetonaceae bacterium]|nr:ABC transporter permease [Chthonomonadaceae bacterium]MDW8209028.1 ABC transporter permease subunit [Chloroherpetonaceae bacterium]